MFSKRVFLRKPHYIIQANKRALAHSYYKKGKKSILPLLSSQKEGKFLPSLVVRWGECNGHVTTFVRHTGDNTYQPKCVWELKTKPEKQLPWWSTPYHRGLKSPVGQILPWPGAELDPLPTPNKSQGTSKIFSKIFSCDSGLNLFYKIFWSIRWKSEFI